MMEHATIYLDHNATTPVDAAVLEAMLPYFGEHFGNASSGHPGGRRPRQALAKARAQTAQLLSAADPAEIVFTSGGTEALNTAIRSAFERTPERSKIVTSSVEHAAVLAPAERLAARGRTHATIGVDSDGRLDLSAALSAIDDDTALVSLLYANNETGVLLEADSVRSLSHAAHDAGALLHLDVVQAAGKVPLDLADWGVDLASISAHKFYGPKGVGALYARSAVEVSALLEGGGQEDGRRGGTYNVPGIVGLGAAAEIAREFVADANAVAGLGARRDRFEQGLRAIQPELVVHGSNAVRLPNTSSVGFESVDADALMLLLGELGVCCSTGAACSTGRRKASHVLLGMGASDALAGSTLRFSLGRHTTEPEIDAALERTRTAIEQLRALSV